MLQAGILDSIFGEPTEAKVEEVAIPFANSQNVGLQPGSLTSMIFASSNTNSDNKSSGIGGGDTTIVAGSALLPDVGPMGTMADIQEIPPHGKISTYTVRDGDTLAEVAKMFDVSVSTIAWANNISAKSSLKEGQILVILPVTGVRHTVRKGETIQSIAKSFKGDVDEILNYNNLESQSLIAGQIIIIPNGEVVVTTIAKRKPGTSALIRGTANGPSYAGYYLRPIAGGVRTQGLHGYNGIDLAAPLGTSIRAAAGGTVIISRMGGWHGGYGNYIVISHPNGTQTLYAHLQQTLVSVGEQVAQGQVIARMGSTGNSTGSHVHFEVRGAKNPF